MQYHDLVNFRQASLCGDCQNYLADWHQPRFPHSLWHVGHVDLWCETGTLCLQLIAFNSLPEQISYWESIWGSNFRQFFDTSVNITLSSIWGSWWLADWLAQTTPKLKVYDWSKFSVKFNGKLWTNTAYHKIILLIIRRKNPQATEKVTLFNWYKTWKLWSSCFVKQIP